MNLEVPAVDWLYLILFPFIGSFLAVLVLRLPENKPLLFSRSACPHCGTRLGPLDLIPLLSWLALRGRCRHCAAPISRFYPLMELAALGIALWAFALVPMGWPLVATCLLGWTLLTLALIDWRHFILPDGLTLPLIALGLGVALIVDPDFMPDHLIGALAGYGFVVLVAFAYRALRGQEGIGRGDAKLLAGAGAWVTWQGLPSVILVAAVLALLVTLAQALMGHRITGTHKIAFGAYLCLALWLVWLYGPLVPLATL